MATLKEVQDAQNAVVNKTISLNQTVSNQLGEIATVLSDFSSQLKNGQAPDPALLDTMVKQMTDVGTTIDTANQELTQSINDLQAADPGPVVAPPPPPVPGPVASPAPGAPAVPVQGNPIGTGDPNTPIT